MSDKSKSKLSFSRGGAEAETYSAEHTGPVWARTQYLPSIGKDNTIYIRFITDWTETLNVLTHSGVKTKPKPADLDEDAKWPASMSASCRNDKGFAGMYNGCYICDNKLPSSFGGTASPRVRVFGLAVLREPVKGTQQMFEDGQIKENQIGRIIAFKTAKREVMIPIMKDGEPVKEDGKIKTKTVEQPAFVVISKGMKNFWGSLKPFYNEDGTLCDRDYSITQSKEGQDMTFIFRPMSPTEDFQPGTDKWDQLIDALHETEQYDLEDIIIEQASDDYFNRFFIPGSNTKKRSEPKKSEPVDDGDDDERPAKKSEANDLDNMDKDQAEELMERLRKKMMGEG